MNHLPTCLTLLLLCFHMFTCYDHRQHEQRHGDYTDINDTDEDPSENGLLEEEVNDSNANSEEEIPEGNNSIEDDPENDKSNTDEFANEVDTEDDLNPSGDEEEPPEAKKDQDPVSRMVGYGFHGLVEAITSRNILDFNHYGNYCGMGGSGEVMDDLDRCCLEHDKCYDRALKDECAPVKRLAYVLNYSYKFEIMENDEPHCKYGEFGNLGIVMSIFNNDVDKCGHALCLCDILVAQCFAKYEYNPDHKKKSFFGL